MYTVKELNFIIKGYYQSRRCGDSIDCVKECLEASGLIYRHIKESKSFFQIQFENIIEDELQYEYTSDIYYNADQEQIYNLLHGLGKGLDINRKIIGCKIYTKIAS